MKAKITSDDVKHIGQLANLKIASKDLKKYARDLSKVISYVSGVQKVQVADVLPTNQVTGLSNIFRDDVVDVEEMLTQKEALSNAKEKHDGYFVIDSIF